MAVLSGTQNTVWARLAPRGSGAVKSRLIRFSSFDQATSTVVYHDADFGKVTIVFSDLPSDVQIGPVHTIKRIDEQRFAVARTGLFNEYTEFESEAKMTFDAQSSGCPTCGAATVKVSGFATFTASRDGVALSPPKMRRVSMVVCAACGTPMSDWAEPGGKPVQIF